MKKLTSSIKASLQLSFFTFIILSTLTGLLSYSIVNSMVAHEELKSNIDQIGVLYAEARKQEKDFILYDRKQLSFLEEGDCESIQKHHKAIQEIHQILGQLKERQEIMEAREVYSELKAIEIRLQKYKATFTQLVKNYHIRGFKDHGLEGEMRGVIHKLQECQSKEEQWYALMLRRHEKDFYIRQDPNYIKTLHNRAKEFTDFVQNSDLPHMSPGYKKNTVLAIENYVQHFDQIAGIEEEIGLSKNEGLIGSLTEWGGLVEPLLVNVQRLIYEINQKLASNSMLVVLSSGILVLACGIFFIVLLTKKISNPIIRLSKIVEDTTIGDETTSSVLQTMKRKDELGKLVHSFAKLFKEINMKVQEISEKNKELEEAAQKERERNWFSTSVSLFEGILSSQANHLSGLCDEFLLNLVKHTKSSQAALFVKKTSAEGHSIMQLQSCYAYDKKRYISRSINWGEGLVGAVWWEKEAFYMNDIPESYSKIRSGLGEAKPRSVFIIPAISEGEVEAVVEIGAFQEYCENEKALMLEVCKGLAAAIARARLQEQTQLLLKQANTLSEELKKNEEDMKQQMEEMLASREKFLIKQNCNN